MVLLSVLRNRFNYLLVTKRHKSSVIRRLIEDTRMFIVRYENDKNNVELTFTYNTTETKEREFKFNRRLDETIGRTFEKLLSSVEKQIIVQQKRKKNENSKNDGVNLNANLYDDKDSIVPFDTLNANAWKDNFKFVLNDKVFNVSVDLPYLKKVSLPKLLISGMPTIAYIETCDHYEDKCYYSWFYSDTDKLPQNWYPIDHGLNKRMCILNNECENRLIKVKVIPSDGTRNGLPVEVVSQNVVKKMFDVELLPMSDRHKLTKTKMCGDNLRVVSYNLLAHAYSDSATAKLHFYPYCEEEFLDFKYRRILLTHELINYNADIIFLQECDEEYFENDLKSSLGYLDYARFIKTKGDAREGESILFRKDRFKFIQSFDIKITDELKLNKLYDNLWKRICESDEEMKELIENRNTILQVILVESIERPNNFILLANTHLFYHPKADFIRLVQSIVIMKHLENLLHQLNNIEHKKCTLLFGGDMNSDTESFAFNYIFTQQLPIQSLSEKQQLLVKDEHNLYVHSLNISTYANFKYTNYLLKFNGILDYIFYDTHNFKLDNVIPLPTHEQVIENVALPSSKIPSDHLALVFELTWNRF